MLFQRILHSPVISIHALREEGDQPGAVITASSLGFLSTPSARRATVSFGHFVVALVISIHALREEGDLQLMTPVSFRTIFLSTPSARRATNLHLRQCD